MPYEMYSTHASEILVQTYPKKNTTPFG